VLKTLATPILSDAPINRPALGGFSPLNTPFASEHEGDVLNDRAGPCRRPADQSKRLFTAMTGHPFAWEEARLAGLALTHLSRRRTPRLKATL